MAKNRAMYGLEKPKAAPKTKREMPFKASRRHEFWSIGAIRFAETNESRSGMASKEVKILDN